MSNVKTINLTGGETKINFGQKFICFWVQNLGSGDVYASVRAGAVPEADGVIAVGAGASARVSMTDMSQIDTLYLSGSGKVQIVGSYSEYCPFKLNQKGGDPSGGSIIIGSAAFFDASSVDIEKGIWNNLLPNKKRSISLSPGVFAEENKVIFPYGEYGVYLTEPLRAIYAVFKANSTNSAAVICKRKTADTNNTSLDINLNSNSSVGSKCIGLVAGSDNVTSDIPPFDDFHVVCITTDVPMGKGVLYIDGEYIGTTTGNLLDTGYYGTYLINQRIISGSTIYTQGDNTFKAVFLDTGYHSEEIAMQNMKFLKNKYL